MIPSGDDGTAPEKDPLVGEPDRRRYTPNHLRGARDHRPARRQPAARASASVQKYRSPREVLMRVRS